MCASKVQARHRSLPSEGAGSAQLLPRVPWYSWFLWTLPALASKDPFPLATVVKGMWCPPYILFDD